MPRRRDEARRRGSALPIGVIREIREYLFFSMRPTFFATPAAFRAWLRKHHKTETNCGLVITARTAASRASRGRNLWTRRSVWLDRRHPQEGERPGVHQSLHAAPGRQQTGAAINIAKVETAHSTETDGGGRIGCVRKTHRSEVAHLQLRASSAESRSRSRRNSRPTRRPGFFSRSSRPITGRS